MVISARHISTRLLFRLALVLLLIAGNMTCYSIDKSGISIVRNFSENDYRGGSKIYSLYVTKKGLLYAGDKSGVIEFDGETWRRIECGFTVNSIVADSLDNIFIAGDSGIGKIVSDSTNNSHYVSLNHFLSIENRSRKFSEARVFNLQNNIISVIGNEIVINTPEQIRIIESPNYFKYYQKLGNTLYLYSPQGGLYKFENDELSLVSGNAGILNKDVRGLYYSGGRLFMIINEEGILVFEGDSVSIADNNLSRYSAGIEIHGVRQLNDTTYALRTYYNGICVFDHNQNKVQLFDYKRGLANNTVLSTCLDHWNNLWIGTASGISVIRLGSSFRKYDTREGIGTGYAVQLYQDNLYMGTSKGLYKSMPGEQAITGFTRLFKGHVWGLHKVGDYLYFGHSSGLYILENNIARRLYDNPAGWDIKRLPSDENFYICNTSDGLLLMRMNTMGQLEPANIIKGTEYQIRNFEFDTLNNIWAEFQNGIIRFSLSREKNEATNIKKFDRIDSGNKLKKVRRVLGEIHFVADSGVYRYNAVQNIFSQSNLFHDLRGRKIIPSNIIQDPYNRVWVFTEGRLTVYKPEYGRMKSSSENIFEYYNNSYPRDYENVFCLNEDKVIIGREQGFWYYESQAERKGVYSSTIIREVLISSKNGDRQSVWGSEIYEGKNYILNLNKDIDYKYNSLKFYFSAGCSNYDNVKYQTHLVGYDDYWSDWSYESIKEYTNLPPGEYKFIIRSVNKGSEFGYVATCLFNIKRPWYSTTVAKIIYGLLFLLLIAGTDRLLRHRAKVIQQKLQKKKEEKTYREEQRRIFEDLMKDREKVSSRNEKLRIDNLYKSRELANSTMSVIKKNQFLTEIKTELEIISSYSEKNKIVTGDIKKVIARIDRDIDNEESWKVFEDYFDIVHENFIKRIKEKYPILSSKDLRLSSYIRMNLSSKEIAPLLNITVRGVEISRYRLRKKLGLDKNDSLNDFLHKL